MKHHTLSYHTVPRETFISVDQLLTKYKSQIDKYIQQLLWWNRRVNLVSRDVSRETLYEHIRHSLLLSEISGFQNAQMVVDAGTGGGLPGIPLAIAHPSKEFLLNDIVGKKVMAVKQIIKELSLPNVSVLKGSIADIEINRSFYLITKHAFKIDDLYLMVSSKPYEKIAFYKGADFENELENINHSLQIDAYQLFNNSQNEFYRDKVLVVLSE